MSNIALYTFGLINPALKPTKPADFARRGGEIYSAIDRARDSLAEPRKTDAHAR